MGRRPKKHLGEMQELTPLELSLMKIIWERGSATAAEISEFMAPSNPLADTTIHTILANLRKKRYIEPVPTIERAYRFAPRVPREKIAGCSLRRILADFFEGSPRRMMAHLLQEDIDETELAEIRQMLDDSGKKKEE
ncbi:MAG TPA: BlaI/MecI/CopY family transcriptional regulator [Candidatus Sumerlaeota bacterium]|nr:BlaI/MecI/CopY family transcriptional regulator [Candidatus Sumerlaeota bacterium]